MIPDEPAPGTIVEDRTGVRWWHTDYGWKRPEDDIWPGYAWDHLWDERGPLVEAEPGGFAGFGWD